MDVLRPLGGGALGACLLALTTPVVALAAAPDPKDPYGERTPLDLPAETGAREASTAIGSGGGSLMRTFVGLAVVVAVIYGVAWLLRQAKGARDERTVGTALRSEAVVALGPNRSVHLIRAGRELVLVGSAEQGVVPLRTYSEREARELGLVAPEDAPALEAGVPGAAPPRRRRTPLDALRERTVR